MTRMTLDPYLASSETPVKELQKQRQTNILTIIGKLFN